MTYQVQVTIPYFNGLPRDCATNVLHFLHDAGPPDGAAQTALITALRNFYFHVYGGSNSIAAYADPVGCRMKLYDLSHAIPRTPILDATASFAAVIDSSTLLPPELAVVLSISGAGVPGVSMQSQRGRVYLGCQPDSASNPGSITSFPTVSSVARSNIIDAAQTLFDELATINWQWVIHSRVHGTDYPVVKGYVDDAFDIQRRRGQDPVIRTGGPF